ncbi:glycosyltransferase [Synechococcus sp. NB0720_010]|uniref:glycosyltransferase n=1 Tax=Synechococcus sp. NB0720_010 TaxID=2907159 RepID=UPI001FFAAB6A|nr:glycosyltransferase [Synechococcus sp. NB0720_010]UPH89132.1 glycosyltransferase [Synechococcus sp. NB0720_010]
MAKPNKNILFITHGYYPCTRLGGPIESVRLLADTLVQMGHTVTVLCTNSNLDQIYGSSSAITTNSCNGVTVYRFPLAFKPNGSLGFMLCKGIIKFLMANGHKFDIYHIHVPFIYPSLIGALFSRLHNKPLIYHQRGQLDPVRLSYKKLKKHLYIAFFEKSIMASSKALIALTDKEVIDYLRIDRSFNSKVRILPNPVCLPSQLSYPTKDADLRTDHTLKLFYLGRIHTLKGTPLLFEALSLLPDPLLSSLSVTIAGPDEQCLIPNLFNKYPMLIRDNIKYVGHLESDAKWDLCLNSDAFILPSWSEGLSMSMLEALVSGNLLLLSDMCKLDNLNTASLDFVKYFSLNPHSIASTIADAINIPSGLLESQKALARQYSEENYHPSQVVSSLISIYTQSLA